MNSVAQRVLLAIYKLAVKSRVLETRWGKLLFEHAYLAYKHLIEARDIDKLKQFVPPGGQVIDVGANIGFFTVRFAQWVGERGSVLAIEPDSENFASLTRRINQRNLGRVVTPLLAAAGRVPGVAYLQRNLLNPADHWIAQEGIPVRSVTIDATMVDLGWKNIDLIKIDVQGYELFVIEGAVDSLSHHHPVLFVEIHEPSLQRAGSDVTTLLGKLHALRYTAHKIELGDQLRSLTSQEILAFVHDDKYLDLVFLPAPSSARDAVA